MSVIIPTPDEEGGRQQTYIIHETIAAKDVGEEARGVLDIRAALVVDHLLPILVVDRA